MGISILLFLVGLRLDLDSIRSTGPVALATGLGQVLFTSVVGFLICLGLGFAAVPALYLAVALTFSSTIIIVKLLSDKREIDSLHGRIAVGFLIVQDIVVVLAMIGLSAVGGAQEDVRPWLSAVRTLGKGTLLLLGVALLMRFVLPKIIQMPFVDAAKEAADSLLGRRVSGTDSRSDALRISASAKARDAAT